MNSILVLGSGSWGTALSQVLLSNKDNEVSIYGINKDQLNDLNNQKNTTFFGNLSLSYKYHAIYDSLDILKTKKFDYILIAVPSNSIENCLNEINEKSKYEFNLINASKGFIIKNNETLSSLLKRKKYDKVRSFSAILGPGFAIDVVEKKFTVLNVLCDDLIIANQVCNLFNNDFFKTFADTNLEASELLANMKNPLAIIVGILHGLNISINVISAFITKGIQEILALITKLNLNPLSIAQYSGIGDIFLTCSSTKSRNYSYGLEIAKYKTSNEAIKHYDKTVEGKEAILVIHELFQKHHVHSIVYKNLYLVIKEELSAKEFYEKTKLEFLNLKV